MAIILSLFLIWSTNMHTLLLIRTSHLVSIYKLGICYTLNLPNLSILSGKLAIVHVLLLLTPQYLSYSKSAWWEDSNKYKNSYVGPKKCHFITPGRFFWSLRIEIFSNIQIFTQLFNNSIKFAILGGFKSSKKGIWSIQSKYLSLE